MGEENHDLGKWIQELVTRAVQEQIHTAQRYGELFQHISPDDLQRSSVREEYAQFARQEAARFVRNLATLSLNYYNSLLELTRSSNERFIEHAMNMTAGRKAEPQPAAGQVPVELRAPLGEQASAAFVIENKRAEPVPISFLASEFKSEGDASPFRAPLEIEPSHLTLNPHEEVVVKLRLMLLRQLFAPGKRYTATVAVSGYGKMELALNILVEAARSTRKTRSASTRKSISATRKTRKAAARTTRRAHGKAA